LSDLESLWEQYQGQGVLVYGLHGGEPAKELTDFIEQTGVTYPILTSNGTAYQFTYAPGVGYPYPRDVVIGKDGTIRSIKNSFDIAEMTALIEELVAE